MEKYVYVLYRKVKKDKKKGKTFYYYFNSSFVENKIILSQIFKPYRWYKTITNYKIKKVEERDLDWTDIIYFNRITVHIVRLFAFFMHKEWYKIQKVEIVDTDIQYEFLTNKKK